MGKARKQNKRCMSIIQEIENVEYIRHRTMAGLKVYLAQKLQLPTDNGWAQSILQPNN